MKNNKKVLVMSTLLMAIVLLSVGTIAYFRRAVNGNITGNTGILVFNVNGLTGETNETLEYSLNRSLEEPYVYPDDSGYFDLEITAEGSSTDVYVTLDFIREHLPDNLKFYTDEEHKVVLNKKYFFFEKTEEMSDTLRIYWYWDGSKDDVNDSLFINEELSARISLNAVPMEYGMMKNGVLDMMNTGVMAGLYQQQYLTMIKEITFTNDFSGLPDECSEENLCFDISYEENQKYPVYAYLVETEEQGTGMDNTNNELTGNLYDMYIVCSKTVFAPFDSTGLFVLCYNLENVNFNDWFNTSLVTSMYAMFSGCENLTNLNVESFNTSSVTNMDSMFYECLKLANLNLGSLDTSSVTDMSAMFSYCTSLTSLNLKNFNTSNVTDMSQIFYGCSNLTDLNLESFDTSSVTSMANMFWVCTSLTSLDLSSFNTNNVTSMDSMFSGCSSLTSLDVSNFNTSNVTSMSYMFLDCSKLTTTITIRGNVSNYTAMFNGAATEEGAKITVNYTSETSALVDDMITKKTSNSNVVKGTLKG